MALKIAGRLFTGPFDPATFVVRGNQEAVVYAVVAKGGEAWDPHFRLIAVGAGDDGVTLTFADLPELASWQALAGKPVSIYIHALGTRAGAGPAERAALVGAIVAAVAPPDGIIPP